MGKSKAGRYELGFNRGRVDKEGRDVSENKRQVKGDEKMNRWLEKGRKKERNSRINENEIYSQNTLQLFTFFEVNVHYNLRCN